jgi:hypothetical protein
VTNLTIERAVGGSIAFRLAPVWLGSPFLPTSWAIHVRSLRFTS